LVPFPFVFARLNALQAAVRHSNSLLFDLIRWHNKIKQCHTLRWHIKQILRHRVALRHFSWLLHPSFGYQIQRQRVPSIPAQANQVALLDIIASLLSNQILRELKLTTLLKTLFFVVIVVVVVVAIVVVTIEGLR
jgi:hypothetical protein